MSDFIEQILNEEQDTDAKFVAAANFFVNLKGKDKEASLAAPARGKKAKQLAVKDSKRLVAASGGTPVPMKAALIRKGSPVRGQAQLADPRKAQSYKKLPQVAQKVQKPKVSKTKKTRVTVKVGSAEAALTRFAESGSLNKEAYVVNFLRGIGEIGEQAAKSTTKAVADKAAKAKAQGAHFKAGYDAKPGNAVTNLWRNITGGKPSAPGGFNSGWTANIPLLSSGGRKVRDVFRNPELVAKENAYRLKQKEWLKKQRELKSGPVQQGKKREMVGGSEEQIAKGLANMRRIQGKNLDMYRKGMDARSMTGFSETKGNVLKTLQGPDGSYSMGSIMKGADELGLFNPATIASLGLGVKGSMDAARAARAAAQRDKMMKWGLAGAGGLGVLALLKGSGNKQQT